MAEHPEGEQSNTVDRTSTLVSCGLIALAILGVVTVFSDAIAAAWSPNATTASAAATSTPAATPATPAAPDPAATTPSSPGPAGAGGSS